LQTSADVALCDYSAAQLDPAAWLRTVSDDVVRAPLWDVPTEYRAAVIHERRRRFGVDDEDGSIPLG